MRKWLIIVFTFLGGIYFFIAFFLPEHIVAGRTDFQWTRYNDEISDAFQVIFYVSIGLGVINIFRVYGYQVVRGRKGWPNALALIIGMLVMTVAGLWSEFGKSDAVSAFFQDFLFTGIYNNLGSAMFSLLAFYIAGAAYRSFRVQSPEAALRSPEAPMRDRGMTMASSPGCVWMRGPRPCPRFGVIIGPKPPAAGRSGSPRSAGFQPAFCWRTSSIFLCTPRLSIKGSAMISMPFAFASSSSFCVFASSASPL